MEGRCFRHNVSFNAMCAALILSSVVVILETN